MYILGNETTTSISTVTISTTAVTEKETSSSIQLFTKPETTPTTLDVTTTHTTLDVTTTRTKLDVTTTPTRSDIYTTLTTPEVTTAQVSQGGDDYNPLRLAAIITGLVIVIIVIVWLALWCWKTKCKR